MCEGDLRGRQKPAHRKEESAMAFSNLIPGKKKEQSLTRRGNGMDPFTRLQHEMDRLFQEFRGSGLAPSEGFGGEMSAWAPAVNLTENEKEVRVTAELPGMDEKDVDVEISHNVLTIKGEKKEEHKEEEQNVYRMERRYGSFVRQIELPLEVESEKAEASFKNGVLTIHLPKSGEAQKNVRKIEVKS